MKHIFIFFVLMHSTLIFTQAQSDTLSLGECVNYALENHAAIEIGHLKVKQQKDVLLVNRLDLLPRLSGYASAGINSGFSVNDLDNSIINNTNFSNNYSLNASVDVFSGLSKHHRIKQSHFDLMSEEELLDDEKNKVAYMVISHYFNALLALGYVKLAIGQIEKTEHQRTRTVKMAETGKIARAEIYEINSQLLADKLMLQKRELQLANTMANLKKSMQYKGSEALKMSDVKMMDTTRFAGLTTSGVYEMACSSIPAYKSMKLAEQALLHDKKSMYGAMLPEIWLSASYSTRYFDANLNDNNDVDYNLQINNNQNRYVGINMSIPIFNGLKNSKNVARAERRVQMQHHQIDLYENDLRQDVEMALFEYRSAKIQFNESKQRHEYALISFNGIQKRFETGRANMTDYITSKQRLVFAETDVIEAKYNLILSQLHLRYYMTGRWDVK